MRDRTIDGFRGVAALGVVFAHAVTYRFVNLPLHYAQRLADPFAQTSVQIFFVISGYIITMLLLKEREKTGRVSIPAFYIRRVCRIIPPLAAYLVVAAMLTDPWSLLHASTFTCNIGDCSWYVAHTWSLSVEEQYYLVWPMMLAVGLARPLLVASGIVILLSGFLIFPSAAHSNFISFACIGVGALVASSRPHIRSGLPLWCAVALALAIGPLYIPGKLMGPLTPFLIAYLIFGAPDLVKRVLQSAPLQLVGLGSYSLYLWQQLFLGPNSTLPVALLPLAVIASVVLIEQPFIRLGRKLSYERAYSSSRLTTPAE